MEVIIGGVLPLSTIDYPGRSASVIFFGGCNFRCHYCYNFSILDERMGARQDTNQVFDLVMQGSKLVDAVVFSGGEPTLQPQALTELIYMFKKAGLAVKIDTNGSNAGIIAELAARNLIDYVAIDVKAPLEREHEYSRVIQRNASEAVKNIREILKLRRAFNFFLECRTTVVPGLIFREHDIEEIAEEVGKYCDLYALQQFTSEKGCLDKDYNKVKSPSRDELLKLGRLAKKHVKNVWIRTSEGEEAL
jgi:pyruvate formate lyase activating enzyme